MSRCERIAAYVGIAGFMLLCLGGIHNIMTEQKLAKQDREYIKNELRRVYGSIYLPSEMPAAPDSTGTGGG